MTKPNSTLIVFVLDSSGSMSSVKNETIDGFNKFLKEQAASNHDEAFVSLATFAWDYKLLFNMKPIGSVEDITEKTYVPSGGTALLDAMAKTIIDTGNTLADMKEEDRPSDVIFVTITDGEENSSKEFSHERVGDMIKHQTEKYNWQFVFLGANFDAMAAGGALGINSAMSMTYQSTSKGMGNMYRSLASNVSRFRGTRAASALAFSDKQRDVNSMKVETKDDQESKPA